MTRQSKPIDNGTKETLKQLHAEYKTAPTTQDAFAITGKALDVLAAATDPKPRSSKG